MAFVTGPDEHVSTQRIGGVEIEGPIVRITSGRDGGGDLWRKLALQILEVPQRVRRIEAHRNVGVQYLEALVDKPVGGNDTHFDIHRVVDRVYRQQGHLNDGVAWYPRSGGGNARCEPESR